MLREAIAIWDELFEVESVFEDAFVNEEVCNEEEEEEKYESLKRKTMLVLRDLQTQVMHVDSD